ARPAAEMRLEAFGEILEPKPHPFEQVWGIGDLLGLTSFRAGSGDSWYLRETLNPALAELYTTRAPKGKTPTPV
ncbi:MAG TPA: hypothetical protein VII86_11730, partial [Thermoanaerobaculia bacterium]